MVDYYWTSQFYHKPVRSCFILTKRARIYAGCGVSQTPNTGINREVIVLSNSYRLNQIYALLLRKGNATVEELAQMFQVTPTTIRRDLLILEERGMIYRTRGAAFLQEVDRTADVFQGEKKRIAAIAARYISSGMSLVLDSGSTVATVLDYLRGLSHLSDINIITHSPQTAIAAAQSFKVSMPGGSLVLNSDFIVGLEVEDFYKKLNVDLAILGSTGVYNCAGLTVSYPLQLPVKKYSAACADKKIAVLDSSKFIRRGIYVFCDFHDVDILITVKTEENEKQLERIADLGVEIVLA